MKSSPPSLIIMFGVGISAGLVGYYLFHRHFEAHAYKSGSGHGGTPHPGSSSGSGGHHGGKGGHGSHSSSNSSHAHARAQHNAAHNNISAHHPIHNVTHPAQHHKNIHDIHHITNHKHDKSKLNDAITLNINADPLTKKELKDPKVKKVRIYNDCAKGASRNEQGQCEYS